VWRRDGLRGRRQQAGGCWRKPRGTQWRWGQRGRRRSKGGGWDRGAGGGGAKVTGAGYATEWMTAGMGEGRPRMGGRKEGGPQKGPAARSRKPQGGRGRRAHGAETCVEPLSGPRSAEGARSGGGEGRGRGVQDDRDRRFTEGQRGSAGGIGRRGSTTRREDQGKGLTPLNERGGRGCLNRTVWRRGVDMGKRRGVGRKRKAKGGRARGKPGRTFGGAGSGSTDGPCGRDMSGGVDAQGKGAQG